MNESESFRDRLLNIITENPGLHFRELQRRTGSAVGQLDYHLYQLERKGEIYSVKDRHVLRFFSSTSDTMLERKIALHMRNNVSKEIILRTAVAGEKELTDLQEMVMQSLEGMMRDGILLYEVSGGKALVTLENRETVVRFLKKYSRSFIDSLAYSIFRMLDEL